VKNFGSFASALLIAAQFSFAQELQPNTVAPPAVVPDTSLQQAEPALEAAQPAPVDFVAPEEPKPVVPEPVITPNPSAQDYATLVFVDEFPESLVGFGLRLGLGASGFRHHEKLLPASNLKPLKLTPAFSLSVGLSLQIELNQWVFVSPELQYSLYRANEELKVEVANSNHMSRLHEIGVYMHALELPLLLRFNLGDVAYLELGPQVGLNLYSKVNIDASYYRPDLNLFAFGVAGGVGFNLSGIFVGIRVYSSVLEYAKDIDTEGYPWSVQFSITPYIF